MGSMTLCEPQHTYQSQGRHKIGHCIEREIEPGTCLTTCVAALAAVPGELLLVLFLSSASANPSAKGHCELSWRRRRESTQADTAYL